MSVNHCRLWPYNNHYYHVALVFNNEDQLRDDEFHIHKQSSSIYLETVVTNYKRRWTIDKKCFALLLLVILLVCVYSILRSSRIKL